MSSNHADRAPSASVPPGDSSGGRRRAWLVVLVVALMGGGAVAGTRYLSGKDGAEKKDKDKSVPVVLAKAERKPMTLRDSYRGELASDVAELTAESAGFVTSVLADLGDAVEHDAPLAVLESTRSAGDLAQAQATVAAAEARLARTKEMLALAEREKARADEALKSGLMSEQAAVAQAGEVALRKVEVDAAAAELNQARARVVIAADDLGNTTIKAPFAGRIAERYVDAGATVRLGDPLMRLVRGGALRVRFRASEVDLGRLRVGQPLSVRTQATGSTSYVGTVTRIGAEVSSVDRTVMVVGELRDHADSGTLKPGMFADISIARKELGPSVVVPSEAVVSTPTVEGISNGVFVVRDGVAHLTPVEIIGEEGNITAVKGVNEGADIVVVGQGRLTDGAKVRDSEFLKRSDS